MLIFSKQFQTISKHLSQSRIVVTCFVVSLSVISPDAVSQNYDQTVALWNDQFMRLLVAIQNKQIMYTNDYFQIAPDQYNEIDRHLEVLDPLVSLPTWINDIRNQDTVRLQQLRNAAILLGGMPGLSNNGNITLPNNASTTNNVLSWLQLIARQQNRALSVDPSVSNALQQIVTNTGSLQSADYTTNLTSILSTLEGLRSDNSSESLDVLNRLDSILSALVGPPSRGLKGAAQPTPSTMMGGFQQVAQAVADGNSEVISALNKLANDRGFLTNLWGNQGSLPGSTIPDGSPDYNKPATYEDYKAAVEIQAAEDTHYLKDHFQEKIEDGVASALNEWDGLNRGDLGYYLGEMMDDIDGIYRLVSTNNWQAGSGDSSWVTNGWSDASIGSSDLTPGIPMSLNQLLYYSLGLPPALGGGGDWEWYNVASDVGGVDINYSRITNDLYLLHFDDGNERLYGYIPFQPKTDDSNFYSLKQYDTWLLQSMRDSLALMSYGYLDSITNQTSLSDVTNSISEAASHMPSSSSLTEFESSASDSLDLISNVSDSLDIDSSGVSDNVLQIDLTFADGVESLSFDLDEIDSTFKSRIQAICRWIWYIVGICLAARIAVTEWKFWSTIGASS